MKYDIAQVAQAALSAYPDLLFRWLPGGKLNGREFQCGDLLGSSGDSLSINITTGRWADFATGEKGGDPVSLYAAIRKLKQGKAAAELAELLGVAGDQPQPVPQAKPREVTARQIIPAPETPPDIRHRLGKPVQSWAYRTQAGALIGYIHRFDKPDGKKEILPQIYAEVDGASKWVWKSFTDPRPLYNLPALNGDATVLLVEGEKTADAAIKLLPTAAVLTWPGGSKAVSKVDWSPLAGRKVMLWPDHDEPGFDAMNKIAAILRGIGCAVRFIVPPIDTPEGWDIADADWSQDKTRDFVKSALAESLPEYQAFGTADAPIEFAPTDMLSEPAPPPAVNTQTHVMDDAPFICLGFDKEKYYYFSRSRQVIVDLTPAQHTENNLLAMADANYWAMEFPKGKGGDFDTKAATNAMMRLCERKGMFQHSKVRGRGAWYDEGRVIVHLGDRLIVNGKQIAPSEIESDFVYEAGPRLRLDFSNPLSNKEANQFIGLLDMLSWEKPIYSKLAAGWCVVAHVCGVMKWRPHIWVVGRKGSGKTYVMSNIIRPVLGDNQWFFQGSSSEAGIRQRLKGDAMPVLFDEAEGEDAQAHANIQRVLGLVRQSSSDTGGMIAKGTPSGIAINYTIRSCFAFSSINANIVQQSDKSRLTILELNNENRKHEFAQIVAAETELLTDEYIRRFYARAVSLAGVIRENAVTFARAAAAALGEQRAGDQIGALLAGAYSLYSDKIIPFETAVEWVNSQDWSEQREEIAGQSDEHRLYNFIMQCKIRVKLHTGGDEELPIGKLIDIAMADPLDEQAQYSGVTRDKATEYLMRNGFKITPDDELLISNTSAHVAKMLIGTPWASNWGAVLKRIAGAYTTGTVYFGFKGSEARATGVPLNT